MADIQTRLREAMRAEAEQASPERLRPLRPLPDKTVRRRARAWGWLVPAAAAMAVVVVIALVTVGLHAGKGPHTHGRRPTQGPSQPVPGEKAVGRPRYLVGLASGGMVRLRPQEQQRLSAVVFSSATGNALASVRLPDAADINDAMPVIAAAGDDRHFVAAVPTGEGSAPVTRFLVLTVGADGRQLTATPLQAHVPSVPWYMIVTGLALTADGSELAVTWAAGPALKSAPPVTGIVQVINMTTGSTRSWSTSEGNPRTNDASRITDPSWGTGDQVLGFLWDAVWGGNLGSGFYLLDTGNPAAGLLAHKIISGWNGHQMIYFAALGGQAQTVVASIVVPAGKHPQPDDNGYPAVVEYSARTGRELRALYAPTRQNGEYILDTVDPSGQHVLIRAGGLIRIDNGVASPLASTGTYDIYASSGYAW